MYTWNLSAPPVTHVYDAETESPHEACGMCRPEHGDCLNAGCAWRNLLDAAVAVAAHWYPGAKSARPDYSQRVPTLDLYTLHAAVLAVDSGALAKNEPAV